MVLNKLLLALPLAALLGACGGGGGAAVSTDTAALREVPASATASPEAYSRYAGSAPADDQNEPLDLAKLVPPTSETAEPVDIR